MGDTRFIYLTMALSAIADFTARTHTSLELNLNKLPSTLTSPVKIARSPEFVMIKSASPLSWKSWNCTVPVA
ncbi:hypothetical protein F7734_11860 [Scytonema sp. UIC 10036]|uniref:hypothetical protein n=1 Tax=Scytonema sp. UIC 10036 TaxID=2304196 RepID=UPI0012DABA69|nr:hypothetical protein [Scytonema sp. UIC 10036]MUG93095.1 hypothetical protein [Scytonema sp. UIC 10036]